MTKPPPHTSVHSEFGYKYLAVRCWIGFWVMLILLLMNAFDCSALVRYITRFTEESFATLIAMIFIFEAFKKLLHIHNDNPIDRTGLDRSPSALGCMCVAQPNSSMQALPTQGVYVCLCVGVGVCVCMCVYI